MINSLEELMTKKLMTVTGDVPVREAARHMGRSDVGDVLLTDEGGKLSGILTDRDIVVRVLAEGKNPDETRCADVCTGDLVTLNQGEKPDRAVELMKEKAVRRLPVVDDAGRPVGLISLGDLAQDRDPKSALGQISAAPPKN